MEYGLYLTIKENNRMERHMLSPKGEELMWESTIQDEIIAFSELGFLPYAELLTVMEIYGEAVHGGEGLPIEEVNLEYLNELFLITNDLISELCKEDPLHGFLTWTHLEDVIPKDDGSAISGVQIFQNIHHVTSHRQQTPRRESSPRPGRCCILFSLYVSWLSPPTHNKPQKLEKVKRNQLIETDAAISLKSYCGYC